MNELTPLSVLSFFEKNVPMFLSKDDTTNQVVKELKRVLNDSRSSHFHSDALINGKCFIKHVISKSIEYLSDECRVPSTKSKEKIKRYIDAFVSFEEMLLGFDLNYRDHTLHSLWVYLFGHEFIIRLGGYDSFNLIGQSSIIYRPKGDCPGFVLCPPLLEQPSVEHFEAMWGMTSILHDLGYPVQTITSEPQQVFGKILDPFAIDTSSLVQIDLGSRVNLLHQSICDLVSVVYRPKSLKSKEDEDKCYKEAKGKAKTGYLPIQTEPMIGKDEDIEMEFRIAAVDKIHSAWSAILAFKNITYLHSSDFHGGGARDYTTLLTKRDILYSIVHHTCEEPKDTAVNRFQFILLLIDDVEEAARYSKGGTERGSKSEFCQLKWEVDDTSAKIELDYSGKTTSAKEKYNELHLKYKTQIQNHDTEDKYQIELIFVDDKEYREAINLFLTKDTPVR